jgi:glycosyltransferase involved in cell wall biosynthesis
VKALLISLYHPELVRGGAQQICYELFEGLKATPGVEPTLLAAVDPSMTHLYKSAARITGFDGRDNEFIFLSRGYDYFWNRLEGDDLSEAFATFLRQVRPDVVHFHHFLLLGLDLLTLTRRTLPEARIVFTFHEFLAICMANGQMVRKSDNSICDRATAVRCHQCFPDISPEYFFMREMWVKRHLASVDLFTMPSRFMIDIYARWGVERSRMVHVTNGQGENRITPPPERARTKRNRFGFFGQMVDNKGVWVILQAVAILRAESFTDFVVELNGDNLQYASEARRREIEDFLETERQRPIEERIVFHNGGYEVGQLPTLMGRIDWGLVPSVWREAFGLVVSEAWLHGRPVICSKIGGPGERVIDEENGLHFAVADPRSLAEVIRRASTEEGLWERCAAGVKPPAGRDVMVSGFLDLYRNGAPATAVAA